MKFIGRDLTKDNVDVETVVGAQKKATQAEINAKAAIPTKLSQLQNDIGAGGGDGVILLKKNIIISTSGWIYNDILALYEYTLTDIDITVDTVVDVNIKLGYLDVTNDMKSANESYNGYVKLYSSSILDDIVCDIKLAKQVS